MVFRFVPVVIIIVQEDTDIAFDGFPASQKNDDDDLLKPDPNFTYPVQKKKPRSTKTVPAKKLDSKGEITRSDETYSKQYFSCSC